MKAALVILTRQLVDPAFLYGLDPYRNRRSDMKVDTIVVDDSDSGVAGTPHPVHRPETAILTQTDLPVRRGTAERLLIGLLEVWQRRDIDAVFITSDRAVLPNTFAEFYEQAFKGPERRFSSESGWLNPIGYQNAFSPSFPMHLRSSWDFELAPATGEWRVAAHMGLTRGISETSSIGGGSVDHPGIRSISLAPMGLFPVSYTNFGALRSVIPALLPVPLGSGASAFLAGLVLQAMAKRRGDVVTLGRPVVRCLEPLADPLLEINEQLVLDAFLRMIRKLGPEISGDTYLEMMRSFSKLLDLSLLTPWQSMFIHWPELLDAWLSALDKGSHK